MKCSREVLLGEGVLGESEALWKEEGEVQVQVQGAGAGRVDLALCAAGLERNVLPGRPGSPGNGPKR